MNNDIEFRLSRLEKQLTLIEDHFGRAFWSTLDAAYDATLPRRLVRCIVCDYSQNWSDWEKSTATCMFGGGKLERYRCPTCQCMFGPQKYLDLDESFVNLDYQLLYSRYSEGDSTSNEIRTFHSQDPQPTGLYLDWGSGGSWNRTVSELRAENYDVWGYEQGAATANNFVVNQRGEISARFDGIFSNNVIEHFRDPISQFKDFYNLLKDGGVMAHSSPCYEDRYTSTRFHTLFLLGRSPHVLAERTGFRVTKCIKDGEYINYVFSRI